MSIKMTSKGSFEKTEDLLRRITRQDYYKKIDKLANEGVERLQEATPKRTGKTAASWAYEIRTDKNTTTIAWTNDNYVEGYYYGADGRVPLVILLVYGHLTKDGYFIQGNDFVSPAITPVINKIIDDVWTEVT